MSELEEGVRLGESLEDCLRQGRSITVLCWLIRVEMGQEECREEVANAREVSGYCGYALGVDDRRTGLEIGLGGGVCGRG